MLSRNLPQQFIVLTLILKMRHQTTKYIGKFFRTNKCSGARLDVSGSRVAGRGGVGKGDKMRVKEHCYVHSRAYEYAVGYRARYMRFLTLSWMSDLTFVLKYHTARSPINHG